MDAFEQHMNNERAGFSPFDNDLTLTPKAIELISSTLDYIEKYPEKWDQRDYGTAKSDTNCFFGMVIRHSGVDPYDQQFYGYGVFTAMEILGMVGEGLFDRAEYVSYWMSKQIEWLENKPTVDDLRERVSIAMSHDFR